MRRRSSNGCAERHGASGAGSAARLLDFLDDNSWFASDYRIAAAPAAIPEPDTLLLVGGATGAIARWRSRRRS